MPPDLDIEERQAAALPYDHPNDFAGPTIRNTCERCLQTFLGKPSRTLCRVCDGGPAPRGELS
jgi:hypothetical protein